MSYGTKGNGTKPSQILKYPFTSFDRSPWHGDPTTYTDEWYIRKVNTAFSTMSSYITTLETQLLRTTGHNLREPMNTPINSSYKPF